MSRHAAILAISFLLVVVEAIAHTPLKSSVPAANASVDQPLEEIVLEFSEPVRLTAVSLADAAGAAKTLGAPPTDTVAKFVIDVPEPLAAGEYVIAWRAVGADTHVISGEVPFSVAGAAHAH